MVQHDYISKIINGDKNGISTRDIAKLLEVRDRTVQRWIKKYKDKKVSVKAIPEHPHHYVIETPNGQTSKGICKHCLIQREFNNVGQANIAWLRNKDLT